MEIIGILLGAVKIAGCALLAFFCATAIMLITYTTVGVVTIEIIKALCRGLGIKYDG